MDSTANLTIVIVIIQPKLKGNKLIAAITKFYGVYFADDF